MFTVKNIVGVALAVLLTIVGFFFSNLYYKADKAFTDLTALIVKVDTCANKIINLDERIANIDVKVETNESDVVNLKIEQVRIKSQIGMN